MKAKVTLVSTKTQQHDLRTPTVEGELLMLPAVNTSLVVFSNPIVPGADGRIFQTSRIRTVTRITTNSYMVTTDNSTYSLEITEHDAS